jgi:hypothetical protein
MKSQILTSLKTVCAARILPLLLLLALPAAVQAQFGYAVTNGTITISGYSGPGGAVTIPSMVNGLPVTSIGNWAFQYCYSLTSVTIPDSVTSIGGGAFWECTRLASVTIGNSVTTIRAYAFYECSSLAIVTIGNSVSTIGDYAFQWCSSLTSVTIPDSVSTIGDYAFGGCSSLASVMIGNSVTTIGGYAFYSCRNLTGVYFEGNAPSVASNVFYGDNYLTVYYLPATTGWGAFFADRPTALWNPQMPTNDANFGVRTNQFSFPITGTTNLAVVVEACTNLANPVWSPVGTNTLTGGASYFSDPRWTNYPARFYRLRSP